MAEEIKPKSNNTIIISAIIAGVVGIMFVGMQQGQKNQQNQIDNLPALVQKLESVTKQVENVNNQFASLKADMKEKDGLFQSQLDRRVERELQGQIDRRLEDLQEQINRRFKEIQREVGQIRIVLSNTQ